MNINVEKLIELLMARRTAGSGECIFVDPIILRDLIQGCIIP